jgi:hypothetical protein
MSAQSARTEVIALAAIAILAAFACGCPALQGTAAPAPFPVEGEDADVLYFFSDACHPCHEARVFVEEMERGHPDLRFEYIDAFAETANSTRYHDVNRALDITPRGVPEVVADGQAFFGEREIRTGLPDAIRAIENRDVRNGFPLPPP